jgi:8-oxo-dGTP diphosphatase
MFLTDEKSSVSLSNSKIREGTSAVLISTDGRLLFQLRDNFSHIPDPGKLDFFGGGREGDESFLDCVVREVHEEIGYYVSPERFEFVGRNVAQDHWLPDCILHNEIFLARDVPIDRLTITEGALKIITFDELQHIRHLLAPSASRALEIFLRCEMR